MVNLSIGQPQIGTPSRYIPRNDPWVHDPAVSGTIYYLSDAIRYAASKVVVVATRRREQRLPVSPSGVNIDASGDTWPIYPAYTHTGNMLVVASVDATGPFTQARTGAISTSNSAVFWDPSNVNWQTSFATGYVSGVTGTIALRPDLTGDALATFIKSTVQAEPQLDGKLTTNGEISPANAVNAIFTPTVTAAASASSTTVTSTSTSLSVRASDLDRRAAGPTNTRSVASGQGVPAPTFCGHAIPRAGDTTVTFSQAGSYTFTATAWMARRCRPPPVASR